MGMRSKDEEPDMPKRTVNCPYCEGVICASALVIRRKQGNHCRYFSIIIGVSAATSCFSIPGLTI